MTPTQDYLQKCSRITEVVLKQEASIQRAAQCVFKNHIVGTDGSCLWLRPQPYHG